MGDDLSLIFQQVIPVPELEYVVPLLTKKLVRSLTILQDLVILQSIVAMQQWPRLCVQVYVKLDGTINI